MTRFPSIALATVAALGFVFQAQAQTSPTTREQVRAEYVQAREQGRLPVFGELGDTPQKPSGPSTVTRAQVLQELAVSGPFPSGEGAQAYVPAPVGSQRERAQVHAEAVRSVRNGTIPGGEV